MDEALQVACRMKVYSTDESGLDIERRSDRHNCNEIATGSTRRDSLISEEQYKKLKECLRTRSDKCSTN